METHQLLRQTDLIGINTKMFIVRNVPSFLHASNVHLRILEAKGQVLHQNATEAKTPFPGNHNQPLRVGDLKTIPLELAVCICLLLALPKGPVQHPPVTLPASRRPIWRACRTRPKQRAFRPCTIACPLMAIFGGTGRPIEMEVGTQTSKTLRK